MPLLPSEHQLWMNLVYVFIFMFVVFGVCELVEHLQEKKPVANKRIVNKEIK